MVSIATFYKSPYGEVRPYLERISKAGFSAIHWSQQWNSDFAYMDCEIAYIKELLQEFHLKLLDLHGTDGTDGACLQRDWQALTEHNRLAGVELVKNRVKMTAELGGDRVIMHALPSNVGDKSSWKTWMAQLDRSLRELEGYCRDLGIRIAVENGQLPFETLIFPLLEKYSPEFIGVCYDSGHHNIWNKDCQPRLKELQEVGDRLIALHLHDNNGLNDKHKIPFTGTIDWDNLTKVIAETGYKKPLNLEAVMGNSGIKDEDEFLRRCYQAAERLDNMVRKHRKKEGEEKC